LSCISSFVVHRVVFGERKRPPHKTSKPLAQHVVEALHMTGLARAFARRPVLLLGQHLGVGRPKVRVEQAALVTSGDALPQQAGGFDPSSNSPTVSVRLKDSSPTLPHVMGLLSTSCLFSRLFISASMDVV